MEASFRSFVNCKKQLEKNMNIKDSLNFRDPMDRFRMIAFIEGLSFLVLLFISMPMKYYFGFKTFSYYVGLSHGYLFVLYLVFALEILIRRRITVLQFFIAFVASIIPFGTFINDKYLKRQQQKA